MRIVSWNINGIRSAINSGHLDKAMKALQPEVICLQEIKAMPEQVEWDHKSYQAQWNPAERKGYSGTLILSKTPWLNSWNGMGKKELDDEGRVITVEFDDFFLVTVYTPNVKRELTRLEFRTKIWDSAFLRHVNKLQKKKPVIFCGDLNCAHKEIDLANPKANKRNAGFTPEERESFERYIKAGYLDSFREFESEGGHYTWWSQRKGVRERNIGWRIDYFFVSPSLRPYLLGADIHSNLYGSDHCPISIKVK